MAGRTHRGPNGRYERSPATAERDARAAQLRADGWTYPAIAAALGFASKGHANDAVKRALAATVREPSDQLRALELERLDKMYRAATGVLERPHVTVSQGRVVVMPGQDGGEVPVPDDAPVLTAIDRLLKVQERRAKLLGLDAPLKVDVSDETDREIRQLAERLGAVEPAGEAEAPRHAETR
jgi:hypothetical protein